MDVQSLAVDPVLTQIVNGYGNDYTDHCQNKQTLQDAALGFFFHGVRPSYEWQTWRLRTCKTTNPAGAQSLAGLPSGATGSVQHPGNLGLSVGAD